MAGFLAPQISETRGGVSAPNFQADTSIGDALTNVSRIFSAGLAEERGSRLTQTEKDRIALQPVIADAINIQRKVQAGSMSASEANIRTRRMYNSAITAMPDKQGELQNAFSSIVGSEFAEPEADLETEKRNAVVAWATDPDNPAGVLALHESYSEDPNAMMLRLEEKMFEEQARQAKLVRLREENEALKLSGENEQIIQDASVDGFMAAYQNQVFEGLNGLMKMFPAAFPEGQAQGVGQVSGDKRSQILTALTTMKAQYANKIRQEATQVGMLDNIEDRFEGGINALLKPFDNVIGVVERLDEEDTERLTRWETTDKLQLMEMFQEAGIPGGSQLVESEYFANFFTNLLRTEISTATLNMVENRDVTKNTVIDRTGGSSKAVTEDGDPTPEATEIVTSMSSREAVGQVKTSVARFKALDLLTEDDPIQYRTGVNEFIIAADTMDNRGAPVSEDTFDIVYDQRFFNVYNLVNVRGGQEADKLDKAVTKNLRKTLTKRKFAAMTALNNVGISFPSLSVAFDGEKFVLHTTSSRGQNETEQRLLRNLKEHGLSYTREGLEEFARIDRARAVDMGVIPVLDEMKNQLRFLNKITTVARKFPEGMVAEILPDNEIQSVPTISNREEWADLSEGQEYEIEYSDGSVRRYTKGDE